MSASKQLTGSETAGCCCARLALLPSLRPDQRLALLVHPRLTISPYPIRIQHQAMDPDGLPRRFAEPPTTAQSGLRSAFDVDDNGGAEGRPTGLPPPRRRGRGGGLSLSAATPGLGSRSAFGLSSAGSSNGHFRPAAVDAGSSSGSGSTTEDDAVRATDGDASLSRLSVLFPTLFCYPFRLTERSHLTPAYTC